MHCDFFLFIFYSHETLLPRKLNVIAAYFNSDVNNLP